MQNPRPARHSKWLNYNNVWTECTPFCIDCTAWFFSAYNVYTSVRWPTLYLDSQSATKIQQQDQYNLYCSTTNTINTTSNTTNPVWLILLCKSLCSPPAPWSTDQCKFQGTNFNWTQSADCYTVYIEDHLMAKRGKWPFLSHKTGPIGSLELGGKVVTVQRLETGAVWTQSNWVWGSQSSLAVRFTISEVRIQLGLRAV